MTYFQHVFHVVFICLKLDWALSSSVTVADWRISALENQFIFMHPNPNMCSIVGDVNAYSGNWFKICIKFGWKIGY